jgi:hypothetical protein
MPETTLRLAGLFRTHIRHFSWNIEWFCGANFRTISLRKFVQCSLLTSHLWCDFADGRIDRRDHAEKNRIN